ncbi:precorrin-3B C17-methyltransferase [Chloroherpeton thalassium ATCC 35110]|uniref:Precorrin-3B C17-methyltransferase n=1 Tax=Chloroherpeton thalassium (strain ATCC 35110 / GB-78) TaxID=517418 RepID=B3QW17_CHLT3|nr:precorrin-3B C(17)-methyltransferase [Chloroherpeton thalassium]ACF14671.1 precorrin-3B C17-methyltransferase [Chloroherpeton thalassium ATCC 35110]
MSGKITVVGLGPGHENLLTGEVRHAIENASAIVGYRYYFELIEHLIPADALRISNGMKQETARAEKAFDLAKEGHQVTVISSGDAGIYGMASLILEHAAKNEVTEIEIEVLPGISALQAAAAKFGAPINHDFCVISLSDLLTPWKKIERRIRAAAEADFVTAVFNPKSRERYWQLHRLKEIFLSERDPKAPVGIARQVSRPEETLEVSTLGEFDPETLDMFSLLIIGNSQSFVAGNRIITPRGYFAEEPESSEEALPIGQSIMRKSFQTIYGELQSHDYPTDKLWAMIHTIHTTADFEYEHLFYTSPGAIATWHEKLTAGGAVIVTDVTMALSGLRKAALSKHSVTAMCYLSDPRVPEMAEKHGITRTQAGIRLAVEEHPTALFVIGNAPTALIELVALVRSGKATPTGIVGAPVGFVNVEESKWRLKSLANIPKAIVEGRKGGSSVAATIVNAAFSYADAPAMMPGRDV